MWKFMVGEELISEGSHKASQRMTYRCELVVCFQTMFYPIFSIRNKWTNTFPANIGDNV